MYERVQGVVTQQGRDISDLVNREADAHGCPPRLLVACAIGESDLDEQAARPLDPADYPAFWPDVSFGLLQQTVAYAPIGDQTDSLDNIRAVREALFDVDQAVQIAAPQLARFWQQYQAGPEALGRYNWPARGLQGNPNRPNIERAWAESARYVVPAGDTPMHYDPDTSDELQRQDWTCSVRTATWLLRALGLDVTAGDMQDRMVAAGLVTPESGLLDGSGTQLARWLSDTFGVAATADYPADWGDVATTAGTAPIGLGGQAWNHWVAVRRTTEGGALEIMNPAPGWMGVSTILTPTRFAELGPFAAVYLAVPEEDELSAEERATLDWWQGVAPVLPGFLNTVEDQATALAQRTRGANHEAAAAILAQLASFRKVSGYQRAESA